MNPKTVFERVKEVAEKKGGKCISVTYFKYGAKLKFKCSEDHIWEALPANILRGHWCKICGNIRQGKSKANNIADMQKLAIKKMGSVYLTIIKTTELNLNGNVKMDMFGMLFHQVLQVALGAPFVRVKAMKLTSKN